MTLSPLRKTVSEVCAGGQIFARKSQKLKLRREAETNVLLFRGDTSR